MNDVEDEQEDDVPEEEPRQAVRTGVVEEKKVKQINSEEKRQLLTGSPRGAKSMPPAVASPEQEEETHEDEELNKRVTYGLYDVRFPVPI